MDQGEYGVGSGRSQQQNLGGVGAGGGRSNDDSYDDGSSGGKKDSTMGKLMEKAGGMLKNENLQQKGAQKRAEQGAYDDTTSGSGGYGGDNTSSGYGGNTGGSGGYGDDNTSSGYGGNTGSGRGGDNY